MQDALFRVRKNGKIGFINIAGQVVIDFEFDEASFFSEGIASVYYKNKRGGIDTKGDLVIPIQYDDMEEFSEGLAVVTVNDKKGYINKKGEFIIPPVFYDAYSFENGFAKVQEDIFTAGSFIDKEGKTVLTKGLDLTSEYREGLINCQEDEKWGYMNIAGEIIINPIFLYAYPFYEGKAAVAPILENQNRRRDSHFYGFIDKSGKMIISPTFKGPDLRFSEGLCAVRNNGFGYIDHLGELIIPYQFILGEHFSEERACVRFSEDGKYGFINKQGIVTTPAIFDSARSFQNGLAAVCLGKEFDKTLYGYINKNGDYIWEPSR